MPNEIDMLKNEVAIMKEEVATYKQAMSTMLKMVDITKGDPKISEGMKFALSECLRLAGALMPTCHCPKHLARIHDSDAE